MIVGAERRVVEALAQYGEYLGMAFQIADDMLDFTGDALRLCKQVGHDLREGKITLPLIHALAAAPEAERSAVERLLRQDKKTDDDWERIVHFVEDNDGLRTAAEQAKGYAAKAQQCLEELEPSVPRTILETAVRLVVERDN